MATSNTASSTLLRVSMEAFVYELQQDLPHLIKRFPDGIYVEHLHDEYGETTSRILRAISILQDHKKVTLHKAARGSHFILPTEYTPTTPHPELTQLQRDLLDLITTACHSQNATVLRTNYAQLARHLKASLGGMRSCVDRLAKLGYLHIVTPSQQGKQSALVIGLGPAPGQLDAGQAKEGSPATATSLLPMEEAKSGPRGESE